MVIHTELIDSMFEGGKKGFRDKYKELSVPVTSVRSSRYAGRNRFGKSTKPSPILRHSAHYKAFFVIDRLCSR